MLPYQKTINGIECCIKMNCANCPYKGKPCNDGTLLQDALETIMAGNHILDKNEIKCRDFVYIEFNRKLAVVDEYVEPCAIYEFMDYDDSVCFLLRDGGIYSYKQILSLKDYNSMWRCWANKPTTYETRNAKWIKKTE